MKMCNKKNILMSLLICGSIFLCVGCGKTLAKAETDEFESTESAMCEEDDLSEKDEDISEELSTSEEMSDIAISDTDSFVPNTGDEEIDKEIDETLEEEERQNVDFADWIDDSEECYRIGIKRTEENEDEYTHLKDYYFVKKDGTVKIVKVDYPSKKDGYDADRYVYDACDFESKYEDITFDGNRDIVISLGHQGAAGIMSYCAFIYDGDDFRYEKSFESIPNPEIDSDAEMILGNDGRNTYTFKYQDNSFVSIDQ